MGQHTGFTDLRDRDSGGYKNLTANNPPSLKHFGECTRRPQLWIFLSGANLHNGVWVCGDRRQKHSSKITMSVGLAYPKRPERNRIYENDNYGLNTAGSVVVVSANQNWRCQ
jgi:hypothetical protein